MQKRYLYLLSVLSGIILSLGWPMNGFPFLLFLGFVPLLFVEDTIDSDHRRFNKFSIFRYAYITFFTWNVLTTWWIWNSTIFGAIMANILNSLFMAIVFWLFHFSKRNLHNKNSSLYLLIFYWIAFEYLHLDWDLSWPWLNLGNGFGMYTRYVQWYEYTGVFGGSLWILLLNIMVFKSIKTFLNNRFRWISFLLHATPLMLILVIPILISLIIYNGYSEKQNPVGIIVTQPNVDPWSEQYTLPPKEIIDKNLKMAEKQITTSTEFIVCPESAIQENLWHHNLKNSPSIRYINEFINKYPEVNIIIGASTFRLFGENEPLTRTARKFSDEARYYEAFNTALSLNNTDTIEMYHKSKLVPGPEKMPFQRLLKPLQDIAFDLGGTVGSLGLSSERTVFTSSDGKFKVPAIICYESIYGSFCGEFVKNGANLLLIITNDGWWGNTAGHRQHFAFAPLRCVETRRSLARSANTGISGFIDQRGDVIEKTGYWHPAVLSNTLNANNKITFYVKYGDYIGRLSAFIGTLFLLISITTALIDRSRLRK